MHQSVAAFLEYWKIDKTRKTCKTITIMLMHPMNKLTTHIKARGAYPGGGTRTVVPDEMISFKVQWPEYAPTLYNAPVLLTKPVWADPDSAEEQYSSLKWNEIDGKTDRRSFEGKYEVNNGIPQNPIGRTGMIGRGLLGKWGPNHAADPIVTRWKRDADGNVINKNGKKVLEFVSIKRTDGGGWAIPGGMVDPGEAVTITMKREFGEEALNSEGIPEEERKKLEVQVNELFTHGTEVYRGYVDDPRNTDNAWMETVAMNFHDEDGTAFHKFKLQAGDDAGKVKWMEISADLALYASHTQMIKHVADQRDAAW